MWFQERCLNFFIRTSVDRYVSIQDLRFIFTSIRVVSKSPGSSDISSTTPRIPVVPKLGAVMICEDIFILVTKCPQRSVPDTEESQLLPVADCEGCQMRYYPFKLCPFFCWVLSSTFTLELKYLCWSTQHQVEKKKQSYPGHCSALRLRTGRKTIEM